MLQISKVNKSYGDRQVLTDVSFTVGAGRLTGFVGGNGAGKTTTMRIILGVLGADSGSVTLNDVPLTPDDRRLFGYLPEERGLYPKMRVAEQIIYLARLHGLSTAKARQNTDRLLDRVGLGERAGDTLESLSLGNQQRAQIAAALVHDPQVLILDEPFSGLDPLAVKVVLGLLKEYAAKGAPVLFSSHQLDIVERLCDDLVIIADGTIRANGSRDQLRRDFSRPRYEMISSSDAGWVRELAGIEVTELDGSYVSFDTDNPATAQQVLKQALHRGTVASFGPQQASLAEIFQEVIA